tara:strand:- start:611 stop:874 length:264 start_codon:yes stop_codon:yes gene_type:complete
MWFWLISAIAGSILGGATESWFAETKFGIWFYKKVDQIYTWAAKKLNIKILENEEKWKKKYPNVANKIDTLEKRVKYLEEIHMNDGK